MNHQLDAVRGIFTAMGYALVPWSVVLLIYLGWLEWGY